MRHTIKCLRVIYPISTEIFLCTEAVFPNRPIKNCFYIRQRHIYALPVQRSIRFFSQTNRPDFSVQMSQFLSSEKKCNLFVDLGDICVTILWQKEDNSFRYSCWNFRRIIDYVLKFLGQILCTVFRYQSQNLRILSMPGNFLFFFSMDIQYPHL